MRRFLGLSNKTVKMSILGSVFFLLFVAFILGSILTKTQNCMASDNEDKFFTNITVKEGDTLWEVAQEHMDTEHYSSIYEYMEELRRMNHLTSDKLYVGQKLFITYYATVEELNR